MRTSRLMTIAAAAMLIAGTASVRAHGPARAADHDNGIIHVTANLEPTHEVPAVSSPAEGHFAADIDTNNDTMTYELTFSGLQAPVTQSHIHFAQPNVNGGIMVWLCGTATNPGPAGTQTCPQSGTITGTITAANVMTVSTQGIPAGGFANFLAAIRGGLAYANIHSTQSPGGEMRGQIRTDRDHDDHN